MWSVSGYIAVEVARDAQYIVSQEDRFMTAYAVELDEVNVMTSTMKQVVVLLEQIEEMKRQIIIVQYNDELSFSDRTIKLEDMRRVLASCEHRAIAMLTEELDSLKNNRTGA